MKTLSGKWLDLAHLLLTFSSGPIRWAAATMETTDLPGIVKAARGRREEDGRKREMVGAFTYIST